MGDIYKEMQGSPQNINRRKLLAGTALTAATIAASSVIAGEHKHHHHHGGSKHNDLIESALDCIKTGEACSHHCIQLIKGGDTSLGECLEVVDQMLPMCQALSTLASADSNHLYEFAQVCAAVCKDCEQECEVHADKHAECKACMESCAECIKECEKLTV